MLIHRQTNNAATRFAPLSTASMHICQSCGEGDEFLMTFESTKIKTRWLCSHCYWKAIAQHSLAHTQGIQE